MPTKNTSPKQDTTPLKKPNLSAMKDCWGSPFVAREAVGRFSGEVLNPRTMANHDTKNEGPKVRLRIGRKIVYSTDSLIAWMADRTEVMGK